MTHFTLKQSNNKPYPIPLRRRATKENLGSLSASLDSVDWSCVYNSNNINSSFDTFLNVFNKHLDIHIPKQENKRANYKNIS